MAGAVNNSLYARRRRRNFITMGLLEGFAVIFRLQTSPNH